VAIAVGILLSDMRYRRWLVLVVAAAGAAIAVLAGGCGSDATASYGRADEWQATIDVIRDNPVWGVGLGRLGAVLVSQNPESSARHAHNLFLTWWAEAGTGALIAWVWLYLLLLWRSLRAALRGSASARTALVALLGFLGISMLDHPANTDRVALAFWIVAGFAAASGVRTEGNDEAAPATEHQPSLAHRPRTGNVRTVRRP
jgi:O-antigen ligase